MYAHTTVGTNDLEKSRAFYDAVLGALGHDCFHSSTTSAGYGTEHGQNFWLLFPLDGKPARSGNGINIGLDASSRDAVRQAHSAALENAGSCDGEPALRPQYTENFYAAYVRDPDGNKLCIVCHKPG